jgi:AraC-like DNA-binding protein
MINGGLTYPTKRWLDEVIVRAQTVAADLITADRDQADAILRAFSVSVSVPSAPLDRVVLRSLLLDVAFKSGCTVHARVHAGLEVRCPFSPSAFLDRFWLVANEDPRERFDRWRMAFFAELNRTHPPSLGSSVGRLVKRDVRTPWALGELGRRFHATPSRVRRAFHDAFGVSVGEYQRLARLSAAMESLRQDKLHAVALSVGFKSRKNFYRAFARLLGTTPGAFKRLPDEQASDLQTTTRRRLLRLR